jgi:NitT/TauT family transport system substrate-binding protein
MPIILIDRSDGGDIILSNKTIKELQNAKEITVLLEIDSINNELIKDFIKKYHINKSTLSYKNKDQSQIQDTPYTKDNAIIIVTYAPYNLHLLKDGFKEIASTKDMNTLLVIDAVCITKKTFIKNKQTILELKKVIDTSIK